jgi:hypothetical protein
MSIKMLAHSVHCAWRTQAEVSSLMGRSRELVSLSLPDIDGSPLPRLFGSEDSWGRRTKAVQPHDYSWLLINDCRLVG